MARVRRQRPVELVAGWPKEPAADAPVEVARHLSVRLRRAMDGRSAREIGRLTNVDYTTVIAILNGTTWPDLMTLARLEAGLRADLWPVGIAASTEPPRTEQEGPSRAVG